MAAHCHNTTGLPDETPAPKMSEYLDARQNDAAHLEALLTAALTCDTPMRQDALFSLVDHALAAATGLQRALDVVRRPEVGA